MHLKSILVIAYCAASQGILSQTCCSGGVPLSNNIGLANEGQGSTVFTLTYDYNNLNSLNAGNRRLDDSSRKRITNSFLLGAGYAITDRISIEGLFTWVEQTRNITQFGNENVTGTKGLGDAIILGKYAIPNLLGGGGLLNIGTGIKLPLGKSDLTTEEGLQLTADLQPGSGATDLIGWLSISKTLKFRPNATISGSMTFRGTGINKSYLNNTASYAFGDELYLNVGYTEQMLWFNTIFNPGLVVKYRKAYDDKIDGSNIPNTGGEWIFLRPELSARMTPDLVLSTRVELPLYSYVEGTQLTPSFRFSVGLAYTWNKKTTNIIN